MRRELILKHQKGEWCPVILITDNKGRWFKCPQRRKGVWEIVLFSWSRPTSAGMKWQSWGPLLSCLLLLKYKLVCWSFNNQGQNSPKLYSRHKMDLQWPFPISLSPEDICLDKRNISALALRKADQPLLKWDKQLQLEQREPAELQLCVLDE